MQPRRKILFFDWRDIDCGHVRWLTPDGTQYGVGNPPLPQVEMHAEQVAVPHGIRLAAQPAQKTEPVDDWRGWGRIIYEDGRYKSWYFEAGGQSKWGSGSPAHGQVTDTITVVGVESSDGFAWKEFTRCDINIAGQRGFDGFTFFVDPHGTPEERYKIVYCSTPPPEVGARWFAEYQKLPAHLRDYRMSAEHQYAMYYAASPDGITWTAVREPIMLHPSDTDSTFFWDEEIGKYVFYTRLMREGRRWVGRAVSDDFLHWGGVEEMLWPRLDDPPDYDIYLNGHSTYPGLPEYRLLFPMFYHRFTERSDIWLYTSTDGIAWRRIPGGPVIAPGPVGAWDSEFLGSGKDLMPFGDGKIATPYSGTPYPHKYPRFPAVWDAWQMGWAWWPQDRLCALTADREGEFQTVPLQPAGKELRVNFRVPRGGDVRIGLVGVDGRSAQDCDPMHGDETAKIVTWSGSAALNLPNDEPVALHVKLRCAELFALEWV
ncbi:MAG: glycoside hydrolase family protein [Armatimonadota bacterium]